MKTSLIILTAALLASCTGTLPAVPDNGRKVVEPSGSTGTVKSWNLVTEQENNAILPFNTMRR